MIWFSPRFWGALALAVVLAISHWFMYDAGKTSIQVKWEQDIAQRAALALAAEQAARKREQELIAERQRVEEMYASYKKRVAADAAGAKSELDRLRRELATDRRPACADPATAARADARAELESELLRECAAALVGMAETADRLAATVIGLQQYVRNVCTR